MVELFEDRMNQSDTTLWRIERDPELRTTILGMSLFDRTPDWTQLRERIEAVTWEIPRLRQKVAAAPFGIGPPRWVPDPAFDLDYHLRRIVAPEPGDLQTLLALGGPIVMAAFDRDRPLWEFTFVEGLADGKSALLQKIHHCATDGVGAIRMAQLLFDEHEQEHAPGDAAAQQGAPRERPRSSTVQVVADNLADQARDAARLAGWSMTAVPKAASAAMLHPARAASDAARTARSIIKLVRPARTPLSSVMNGRGLSRRLAAMEISLDELRAAGHAGGGTMNDAFLAALTGGMRHYHVLHGVEPDHVRVTMPINLRKSDHDTIGNNRFTPARFALPIDVTDPLLRMKQLGALARSWQHEPGLKYTDIVAGVLNALPEPMTAAALGSMLKAIDFVATNVPGLVGPAHLAGAAIERQFAFAPTSGSAFSVALLSHLDVCTVGMLIDISAVRDPDVLASCMADGFEEVLAVGRPVRSRRR
ncbi:MAG: wax ester/triacylglycerol synthase domain-containing protein [Acidimicrobiia bacterium]